MPVKVAVVGAGALGLMAMKNFKDDGFDVTGYESRSYLGGLWKDSPDSTISVHSTTVFNSSKFRAAISDFPFPEGTDDYPTAVQMLRYLEAYADHFELRPLIRVDSPVTSLKRVGKQWAVQTEPKNQMPRTELFDKVAIATGSFYTPKVPKLDGIESFVGRKLHSIDYHGPEPFKGKTVLVLGVHATAQDVAASLSETATRVYMSHRKGLLLFPRYMENGAAYDQSGSLQFTFIQILMQTWLPDLWTWVFDKILVSISKKAFPEAPPEWNFLPAPSMAVSPPLVGDKLYALLERGFAIPVSEVRGITAAREVELVDGKTLGDIDDIVYCTGYDFHVPFIDREFDPYPKTGQTPLLYRNIFSLHTDPEVRTSLAFLGQLGIPFPGFVQHEMASTCVSQIWRGKASLPPLQEMQQWHEQRMEWRRELTRKHGESSTFYTAFVPFADHFRWIDEIAGTGLYAHFGWFKWRAWLLWWNDRELYQKCLRGLFTPAIWRLFDMGKRKAWDGAREQVLYDNESAQQQQRRRQERLQQQVDKDASSKKQD